MDNNRRYLKRILIKPCCSGTYIDSLAAVKYLNKAGGLDFDNNVTFFVGENGTGKSTLIEAIALCAGFNAEGGSKKFNFATKSTESVLYKYITPVKGAYEDDGYFLRAESFYNVATNIEQLDEVPAASRKISESYGGKSLHKQSHGESFISLVENRFSGNGLYILDEPEAALSPMRQMTLLRRIKQLCNNNSQFIIATHSPVLLSYPNALIYQINESGINKTAYKDCEHYKTMKEFLDEPERMLHYLFNE